jgi:hypothetical protein
VPKSPWPLDICKARVAAKWGNEARHYLGDVLYENLLNAELLLLLSAQDDTSDPAAVVRVLSDGRSQIIDEINRENQ